MGIFTKKPGLLLTSMGSMLGAYSGSSELSPEEAIHPPIPVKNKFAKIELGWSQARVHDTIGKPTDTRNHTTGKAWVPFYFGSDSVRVEDLYKGQGRIIYAGGAGLGSQGFSVYKIIYDPNESGYNDKNTGK